MRSIAARSRVSASAAIAAMASLGATAAECWLGMFFLERACTQQIMALTIGRENLRLAPEAARAEVETQVSSPGMKLVTRLAWPGTLRDLDRRAPGYDI